MKLYETSLFSVPVRQEKDGAKSPMKVRMVRHYEGTPLTEHESARERSIGILWLHGGGYESGMTQMIYASSAIELARAYNVTLFSPEYVLSGRKPYPAALWQVYDLMLYLKENSRKLDIRKNQLMVGGESAGGGLAAALCMLCRDLGEVNIAYQMPLYPMLDDRDTSSSRDNTGLFWSTARNHKAWKKYLRALYPKKVTPEQVPALSVPPYAAPARQTNYRHLPPCYTFVGSGEPFYQETVDFVEHLKKSGVPAHVDVYDMKEHGFDMTLPMAEESRRARERFVRQFEYAMNHFSAKNL